MNTNHSLTVSMQAILTQTWVVVGKVKVGGDGGRRADGTAERTWWKGLCTESNFCHCICPERSVIFGWVIRKIQ